MSSTMTHINHINPIDRDALRDRVRTAQPVRNFCVDNFLEESFAERVLWETRHKLAGNGQAIRVVDDQLAILRKATAALMGNKRVEAWRLLEELLPPTPRHAQDPAVPHRDNWIG